MHDRLLDPVLRDTDDEPHKRIHCVIMFLRSEAEELG
jgi:hypothetical protein